MILVIDWETTGLTLHPDADVRKAPKAIEFGAMLLSPADGSVQEEANIMINPGEPITPEITKITGITDADVADALSFRAALPQIERLFAQATSVWAHNLPFDKSILRGELARHSITEFPWPPREFCTVGLYREHWGRNPRLIELYEFVLGRKYAQSHRAADDVRALVEVIHAEELWRLAAPMEEL